MRAERGYQRDEVHQAKLFIQLRLGQLDPAPGPPPAETMRPNAPHDPAVEFVEERSNVGAFVVLGPTSQGRIQFLYQLRCLARGTASRQPPHPIPESSNGFACGICDQPFWVPSLNNTARNLAFPAGSHHSVSQKIKSLLNVMCTIRVFCGFSRTPYRSSIRVAAANAASVSPPEVTRCSSVPCRPQSPWYGG